MNVGEVPAELVKPALSVQVEEKARAVPSGPVQSGIEVQRNASGNSLSWSSDVE